jgi:3-oxoadipate enol-lactonase
MPVITADDGCPLNVIVEGADNAPVLMLSNSLGTNLHMWDKQADAFKQKYRLVRYDRRGHGKSGAPKGPYSMERLGKDVLSILDGLGVKKTNWCGLSMGGMVGQWLGANAPDRVEKLILSNTTCYYADKAPWMDRIKLIREKGLAAIVPGNMERWFTKDFRDRSPDTMKWMSENFVATPLEGYIGCVEAIAAMDHRELLPKIKAPTLVIAGKFDPATTVEAGEYIKSNIPGAQIFVIDAAHISNIEQPELYTKTVLDFLASK